MREIDKTTLEEICKIGQGHDCCRYIIIEPNGIVCAKGTGLQITLDARGDAMVARGDNCEGLGLN